ncbi:sulfite oxidase [Planctomicrobium piriforme]|uniref:Mo-co oxidoreductase dimerisation domain-containing protein n=1 Tax=Planctomicrobium piriforme TaxID=1576369 RepID=A0A1I3RD31_9PLAN|nr:sulfite oxidase [Planctomicrobium piriforme]SFJ43579.1 Mo-co oxidoreductase dimerisation domain-containing protein [Planctomicrobium piriforme]
MPHPSSKHSVQFGSDASTAWKPGGLIIREKEPLNLEFPFSNLQTVITPTNQFFVRSHFPVPSISAEDWRLEVTGEVDAPFKLSYDELRRLPAETRSATIECAGNGRAFLVPKAKGVLWETGAVGNANWTGVRLSTVLQRAGVKPQALEAVFQGADSGVSEEPKSPGVIYFERSLPLTKANRPEVLLAYQMNGQDLTREHGFPVRLVVPGWFGMASVKWLNKITLTATPFNGFWQTLEYAYFQDSPGGPSLVALSEMAVKATIAQPVFHETIASRTVARVCGAAWSGENEIDSVELSMDGGTRWVTAQLLGEPVPYSWRLWEYDWQTPARPGRYQLKARARDKTGEVQPSSRDQSRLGYMINHTVPLEIELV